MIWTEVLAEGSDTVLNMGEAYPDVRFPAQYTSNTLTGNISGGILDFI